MADVVQIIPMLLESFRFIPNDEQMINFLRDRVLGRPVPGIQGLRFRHVNVYGSTLTPHQIFIQSEFREFERGPSEPDKERYCFTHLKRTTEGGKKFVRTTGGGTWKLQSTVKIITDEDTFLKRQFSYRRTKSGPSGPAGPDEFEWVMYEYSFASSPLQLQPQGRDIAICKVKKNLAKKRTRPEEDEADKLRSDSAKIRSTNATMIQDTTMNRLNNVYASPLNTTFPDSSDFSTRHTIYGGEDVMMHHSVEIPDCPSIEHCCTLEELFPEDAPSKVDDLIRIMNGAD